MTSLLRYLHSKVVLMVHEISILKLYYIMAYQENGKMVKNGKIKMSRRTVVPDV